MPLFDCLVGLAAIPTPAIRAIKSQSVNSDNIFINATPVMRSKGSPKSSAPKTTKKAPTSSNRSYGTKNRTSSKKPTTQSRTRSSGSLKQQQPQRMSVFEWLRDHLSPHHSASNKKHDMQNNNKSARKSAKRKSVNYNKSPPTTYPTYYQSPTYKSPAHKSKPAMRTKSATSPQPKKKQPTSPPAPQTKAMRSKSTSPPKPSTASASASKTGTGILFTAPKSATGGLYGADFYHGDSQAEFNQSLPNLSWVALKATQGSYKDPTFDQRWSQVGKLQQQGKMPLRIAYDFLNPGSGSQQANYFLKTVGVNGKLPAGTRLALDFEGPALKSPQTLKDAAQTIYNKTGQWPLVYASTSQLPLVKKTVPQAPIWEANYSHGMLRDSPFFQFTDKPYDRDVFNGTMQQLRAYAGYPQ